MIGKTNSSGKDYLSSYIDGSLTDIVSNVTSVKDNCFYEEVLSSVKLPNATTLGTNAFRGATISTLELPLVTQVGSSAFNVTILPELYLPSYVTATNSIGLYSKIKKANLPALTTLTSSFFYYNTVLEELIFSPTQINVKICNGCSALTKITLKSSSVCSLSSTNYIPASSSQHITIYVPSDLVESYKTATNWKTLYDNGYIDFAAISS